VERDHSVSEWQVVITSACTVLVYAVSFQLTTWVR